MAEDQQAGRPASWSSCGKAIGLTPSRPNHANQHNQLRKQPAAGAGAEASRHTVSNSPCSTRRATTRGSLSAFIGGDDTSTAGETARNGCDWRHSSPSSQPVVELARVSTRPVRMSVAPRADLAPPVPQPDSRHRHRDDRGQVAYIAVRRAHLLPDGVPKRCLRKPARAATNRPSASS